jgi:hypothetical protein
LAALEVAPDTVELAGGAADVVPVEVGDAPEQPVKTTAAIVKIENNTSKNLFFILYLRLFRLIALPDINNEIGHKMSAIICGFGQV